jgi:plastocyanin
MLKMIAVLGVFAAFAGSAAAEEPVRIFQKGKTFHPDHVEIAVGTTVYIENDDRVLHHVYIEHPNLNFDSGEQPPGRRVEITFDKPGTYHVGCDIHPKMHLEIVVR